MCVCTCVRRDGATYWATDTRYAYLNNGTSGRRRDIFSTKVPKTDHHGRTIQEHWCCEAVIFLTIGRLDSLPFRLPATEWDRIDATTGTLTFVLGRWFSPHESSRSRDICLRPLCPGPLIVNHCLWRYARAPTPRRALGSPTPRQKDLFGRSETEQNKRIRDDMHAYFTLIDPDSILSTVNMCPEFITNTDKPDTTTWLQTVCLIWRKCFYLYDN